MSKSNQIIRKNRDITNHRIRSNSADTKLIKKYFTSNYRELCGNDHSSASYESNQINIKRFQLIRTIDNISASYTSWRDLLNEQISMHYQLYPILENIRSPNSNLSESPYSQKRSDYQNSQNASEMSDTPMTNQEANSIETAQNLIKLLLKKQHDIPEFFQWQWIQLFGKLYEQKQLMSLYSKNFKSLKQEIILSHIIGLNIKQNGYITKSQCNENQNPLLLVLYQNSNFKENQKQILFKKIINQIAFIRLLQVSKQKIKNTLSSFQFQCNYSRKQRLQKIALLNRRPIEFFIVFSKTESIQKLKQKFESFYLNTLNLISTQHNVTFNFLVTEKAWQFNNIQEIVQNKFLKKGNQTQNSEVDESDEEGTEENNFLNRGILDIEMSDDYQNELSSMSDDYEDVLNLIGQKVIFNNKYDKVPQNSFKKKKQVHLSYSDDENFGSNNILDYIMKSSQQNQQKEENHFPDKFLQLIVKRSKENKLYYETVHNNEENEDMGLTDSVSKKQIKSIQELNQEKEKEKQQNIQEQ